MSRVCPVTGRRPSYGKRISRRGLAKSKGGVGLKTTGITSRRWKPNLQSKRIWVPELQRFVRVRLSTHALKWVNKRGAYRVLLDAGLVRRPVSKKKRTSGAAPAAV